MSFAKEIVFLQPCFFANKEVKIFTSSWFVTDIIVSVSDILASWRISGSKLLPLITNVSFKSALIFSALSLFNSINFVLAPNLLSSSLFARDTPIFPPPTIITELALVSLWQKKVITLCNSLVSETT